MDDDKKVLHFVKADKDDGPEVPEMIDSLFDGIDRILEHRTRMAFLYGAGASAMAFGLVIAFMLGDRAYLTPGIVLTILGCFTAIKGHNGMNALDTALQVMRMTFDGILDD